MSLHIGILTRHLLRHYGGCERTCASISAAMLARGHSVSLFTERAPGAQPKFALDPRVRIVPVEYSGAHSAICAVRDTIKKVRPDVSLAVASYDQHLFWTLALLGTGIPHIYAERNCPEWIERLWNRPGRLAAMSGADAIQMLLPEYADSVPLFLRERVRIIPNAVPPVEPSATSDRAPSPPFTLLSLGMFRPAKQLHVLVEAFEKLFPHFPDWRLQIWGEGASSEYARNFLARVDASSARKAISLCGTTETPRETLGAAHIFCIPSRYEGIPNTVLEAMACGTPVVGFADCAGVRSLVRPGINGLLAPERSAESLRDTLASVMENPELRRELGRGALQSAHTDVPQPSAVYDLWENLFYEVAACKGNTQMDAFAEEPFASQARLSSAARREWIFRDFGQPFPGTFRSYREKASRVLRAIPNALHAAFRAF